MLPRIESPHIIAVMVEKMEHDLRLAQELKQLLVDGHLAKNQKLSRVFDRNVFSSLFTFKIECILLAVDFTAGENVKPFLLTRQNSR